MILSDDQMDGIKKSATSNIFVFIKRVFYVRIEYFVEY